MKDAVVLRHERHLKIFLHGFNARRAQPGGAPPVYFSKEILRMIFRWVLPPMQLVRACYCDKYTRGNCTPCAAWLAKFMKIEREILPRKYQGSRARKETFAEACSRFQDSLTAVRPWAWDHVTRFYQARHGKNQKRQFLLYEPYQDDQEFVATKLRGAFGDDNYNKFVHTRAVEGGMQVFIFGSEIDQDTVLCSPLFLEFSYFSRTRELKVQDAAACRFFCQHYTRSQF
jgi:hypothetical protein